jgi:uncharacterized metal-binding protein YceD (DUF177 family)
MTDRFAHRLKLDQVRDGERVKLVADEAERKSVAGRLGLSDLDCLQAHATLTRKDDLIEADGRIVASLTQNCVVTGVPVPSHVDEAFSLIFMPAPQGNRSDEEVALGPADCDVVFYDEGIIDLGSAIADTLALSLNPYPRSAGADAALKEAGILTEAEAGPFAALAQLKKGSDNP